MNLEWSEHMHETVILWSWLSLVSTATTRGSIRPALRSATPVESKTTLLFLSSASVSGLGGPPVPSAPNCAGSTGVAGACGATTSSTGGGGGAPPPAGASLSNSWASASLSW